MSEATILTGAEAAPETPAAAEPAAQPEAQAAPTPEPAQASSAQPSTWRDILPDDIKNDPSINKFEDVSDLAKSYLHAQKMVGSNKISIPDKHATADDWKRVFHELGNPKELENYDVKPSNNEVIDEEFFGWYKEKAHSLGILPHQAQDLINDFTARQEEIIKNAKEQQELQINETVRELHKEWGQAYDQKVNAAQRAVKELGGDELIKALHSTGAGNDPTFVKAFAKVAELMREDGFVEGGKAAGIMTPAEAIEKAKTIMADETHPFNNMTHPNHGAAKKEVERLYQLAYPE